MVAQHSAENLSRVAMRRSPLTARRARLRYASYPTNRTSAAAACSRSLSSNTSGSYMDPRDTKRGAKPAAPCDGTIKLLAAMG